MLKTGITYLTGHRHFFLDLLTFFAPYSLGGLQGFLNNACAIFFALSCTYFEMSVFLSAITEFLFGSLGLEAFALLWLV